MMEPTLPVARPQTVSNTYMSGITKSIEQKLLSKQATTTTTLVMKHESIQTDMQPQNTAMARNKSQIIVPKLKIPTLSIKEKVSLKQGDKQGVKQLEVENHNVPPRMVQSRFSKVESMNQISGHQKR